MEPELTLYIFHLASDAPDWGAAASRIGEIEASDLQGLEECFADTRLADHRLSTSIGEVQDQLTEDVVALREAMEVAEKTGGRMLVCRTIGGEDFYFVAANKIADEPEHYYEGVVARLSNLGVLDAAGYEFS